MGKAPIRAASAAPSVERRPAPVEATELLYGLRAGLAVYERRRRDIRSIGYDAAVRAQIQPLLSWAAGEGLPVRELSVRELAAEADSNQHEGLLLRVQARAWVAAKDLAGALLAERALAVALDRVRNPQNIGAILRSAAFFGARAALLGAPAPHPGLPPFALRVAQGAAEHLSFSRTTDLADTLARLRSAGLQVIGADTHGTRDAERLELPGAAILVLGNEREGLSPRIRAQCDALVGVKGSGAVESLNVAVAAGVILAALRRARGAQAV
jgi:RNA methyltransferase, TrmH family